MSNINPAVIIPAFNRPRSLNRLLQSINSADYRGEEVLLIISLEGDCSTEVINIAHNFIYKHGEKQIVKRKSHLGLKEHILWCGDQSKYHGSVIILEDDLVADPAYYLFARQAITYYRNDPLIAGISLYAPRINEYACLPFEPLKTGHSVYFSQVPCSWGQAWTYEQWQPFREWLKSRKQNDIESSFKIPCTVKGWPESSWKKYFADYLISENRLVVYPYDSLTTNCSDDPGTHIQYRTDDWQVPLAHPFRDFSCQYNFPSSSQPLVAYDSFYESRAETIKKVVEVLSDKDFEVDLYALKPLELLRTKQYVLTTKYVSKPIAEFNLSYQPLELNVILTYVGNRYSKLRAYLAETKNLDDSTEYPPYSLLSEYFSNISARQIKKKINEEITNQFHNSLSWKVTRPLRRLKDIFSRWH